MNPGQSTIRVESTGREDGGSTSRTLRPGLLSSPFACLISLLTLFAVFCPFLMGQQQEIVQEVRVIGNRRIPQETIRARIFTKPGDVYDPAALERDFNSLWNTGYFEDVRFERQDTPKGVIINIYVKERPTIRTIDYVGLNSVSKSDVLDRFKEAKVGLSVESQYDPTKIKKAEVVLKELLSEHGRQFATVKPEIRPIPPAAVAVLFVVKEGPKVKVGKIKFEGNKKLGARELRRSMKNLRPIGIPHSIVLEDIISKTYDASKLSEDAERVRDAYQQKGYYKALVQDPKTHLHDTHGFGFLFMKKGPGKAVDITLPIEEGVQYRLGKITFKNNKALRNSAALRNLFPLKDGDIFNTAMIRKGLENLRKAYGEFGYINFTAVPNEHIDDDKKLISLDLDLDEGKQFYVRRIEFQGNTTTRDKVIRRELAIEEGQVYNTRLWELSLLRLNQLNYFEALKPEDPGTTDRKLNEAEGTVDLTLKVREKGKNSISLTGGVSGLEGSFIGIAYQTNNFLGLGETLSIQANVGNLQRNILFGFTEPYMFDRPLQMGFTVYYSKYNFDQARNTEVLLGQQLNLPTSVLDTLQNFSQSSTGFTTSLSYPLHRSFKRVGLTYGFDVGSTTTFTTASSLYFQSLAFSGLNGPDALKGIITSKFLPSFTVNTIDRAYGPTRGTSFYAGGEIAGIGGTVRYVRPILQYKRFQKWGRNIVGFQVQGSFLSGYGGLVAPPFQRFYAGGDNDLRGFDIRTISPVVFLPDSVSVVLTNPDGTPVPVNPNNPRAGFVTIPIPVQRILFPGGDTSLITNFEYRIPVAGPVTVALFSDFGFDGIARPSQLRLSSTEVNLLNTTVYGCPSQGPGGACQGGTTITVPSELKPVAGTNFIPRMSTGLELQVMMPVINQPFRVYWAYNPLRLDSTTASPIPITRNMFPPGGAGDFTFKEALNQFSPSYVLKEPRKTFRFTVSTTF